MDGVNVYFSDYFNVDASLIDEYGAINISLINDMPLFIDPFLLFNSEKEEFQQIHREIIDYLVYLQEQVSRHTFLSSGMRNALFDFSEVKQTWLGFSLSGNSGRGMGNDFANSLFSGLNSIFSDFSRERITQSRHMEKLCLISDRVGKDKISDFTTCFAKRFLLEYTEKFAKEYIAEEHCSDFSVQKAYFNWNTKTWATKKYYLPVHNGDFVLLTPKDMLTRDETFINRIDMIRNLEQIAPSIEDDALRFQLNQYLTDSVDKKIKQNEKKAIAEALIRAHPELIDYYIKYKEDHKQEASSLSKEMVDESWQLFIDQAAEFISELYRKTEFYTKSINVHSEALERVKFIKHVIEDQDCYKLFYVKGKPIQRESDLQVIYRLTWFGSPVDVNREVNNGRGPVDYKASIGKENATLVEFKLAKNSKLKQNLQNQVEVYKKASETDRAIKVIMYFTKDEETKLINILNELGIADCPDIVLIDARSDNKPSASNVR